MLTAAQALDVAHESISDRSLYNSPCDIVIEPATPHYRVTFTAESRSAQTSLVIVASVHAESGETQRVQEIGADARPRQGGLVSGHRAFHVALERARELEFEYDERGKTVVTLRGHTYTVTFPLLPVPPMSETADYGLRISLDARTGSITHVLGAS